MRAALLATALFAWLGASTAFAEKVRLDVKVVEASTQGKNIDPKLKHMEADFKHKGFAYSSYKLVSEQQPVLDVNQSASVPVPSGKQVKLTLQSVTKGAKGPQITMHVTIPDLGDVDYTVGNRGTNFLGAGPVGHGTPGESQVFLVIQHTAL